MLGLSKEQMLGLAAEFAKNLTAADIATFPPIKNHLINSLNDNQLNWLSNNILTKPNAITQYFASNAGRQAINQLFAEYQRYSDEGEQQPQSIRLAVTR